MQAPSDRAAQPVRTGWAWAALHSPGSLHSGSQQSHTPLTAAAAGAASLPQLRHRDDGAALSLSGPMSAGKKPHSLQPALSWSSIPLDLPGRVLGLLPTYADRARFAAVCPQ
ncbi:F-box protein [Hordeum vulgare]|nr:F-box protein [Hordeum vulgare]